MYTTKSWRRSLAKWHSTKMPASTKVTEAGGWMKAQGSSGLHQDPGLAWSTLSSRSARTNRTSPWVTGRRKWERKTEEGEAKQRLGQRWTNLPKKKKAQEVWKDGSLVKSKCYSCRGPELASQYHVRQALQCQHSTPDLTLPESTYVLMCAYTQKHN